MVVFLTGFTVIVVHDILATGCVGGGNGVGSCCIGCNGFKNGSGSDGCFLKDCSFGCFHGNASD